jgi:hypothetical protein
VIVALHVATGAAIGAATGRRSLAVPLGVLAHFLGDVMPHHDIRSRRFEIASGIAALGLVAAARGPFDPATVGAAAASSPDVEHLLPRRRDVFPSHRWARFHNAGGLPASVQLLAAGALLGTVVATRVNRHTSGTDT